MNETTNKSDIIEVPGIGQVELPAGTIEALEAMDYEEGQNGLEYSAGLSQWTVIGDSFYGTSSTCPTLPPGHYTQEYDMSTGQYYLKLHNVLTEEILEVPDNNFNEILDDIHKFWNNKENYEKHNYVYKRGILLYGPPGCGKSSLISLIEANLIHDHKGVVISVTNPDQLYDLPKITSILREIEPNRPLVIVIEDIDTYLRDKVYENKVTAILDGDLKIDNVVVIATTNFPEELDDRIAKRPSRFAKRVEIGFPSADVRKFYIESKLNEEELKSIDMDLWLKETKDFTLDHIKEVILSVFVLDYKFEDAIKDMKDMIENNLKTSGVKKNSSVGYGSISPSSNKEVEVVADGPDKPSRVGY